jgi:iron complex outermembrane receptor protein
MKGIVLILRSVLFLALSLGVGPGSRRLEASTQANVTFEGVVEDPEGRPVPGVSVEIRNRDSGFTTSLATDQNGRFHFQHIPAGDYRVRVELAGFTTFKQRVPISQSRAGFTIGLEIAPLAQEVLVTASMPELVTEMDVSGEELQEQTAQDVGQSLRDQTGLFSIRRASINMEPSIRGLQENEIAMFVDGTRTFAAGPGRMDSDMSHVSPHMVQSIRVVKGPYALTWGAGTLSAIQLETFRPSFSSGPMRAHGRLGFNYGGNGGVGDGFAGVWGSNDRLRFTGLFNARVGNDYRDGGGNLIPGDYQSYDTRWDLGWQASPETILEYSGGYQQQRDIDYPGRILDATFFKTQSHAIEMTWKPVGHKISELYAQFFLNFKGHLMNNDEKPTAGPMPGRIPPFGLRVDLPTTSDTIGGRFYLGFDRGPWHWKVGLDFYDLDQSAERFIFRRADDRLLFRDIVWPDANTKDLGIYGQAIHKWNRAQLGATVRLDTVDASAGEVSAFFLENTMGDLEQNETHPSFAVSGNFQVRDGWILTAGVGRSVRSPTTLERYSDRFPSTKFQVSAEFMGNPGLEPEKSLELNVGSVVQVAGAFIEGDFFYRTIDDYITVVPDPSLPRRLPLSPPVVFRDINGTEARFWGYELGAQRDFGSHIVAKGSLSYVWGEDKLQDEPAFGIPPLELRLAVQFHSSDRTRWVELGLASAAAQDRVATARLELATPGWTTVDLRGAFQLGSSWTIRLGVENMGDNQYATHLNALSPFAGVRIPEPGRSFYLGLAYNF